MPADVGRLLIVGFSGLEPGDEIRFALRDLGAGGVILFTRNYESPEQVRDLVARLRGLSPRERLWVCVDHEGGPVQRFRDPFTIWPDMATLGRAGDVELARRMGAAMAAELAAVGIDQNFAPVADVNTNPDNPVIGARAFSSDARTCADFAVAVIEGLQGGGVAACAKHFPGHGDTDVDSHHDLPVLAHDRARLDAVELVPFAAAARAGVASFMSAHIVWPALDAGRPATLSPVVLEALARALPYDGVIVSDDLEMAAVAKRYAFEDAAPLAVAAGCDALLVCKSIEAQESAYRGLFDAVRSGALGHGRIDASIRRLARMSAAFPARDRPSLSIIGCDAHRALAGLIASRGG